MLFVCCGSPQSLPPSLHRRGLVVSRFPSDPLPVPRFLLPGGLLFLLSLPVVRLGVRRRCVLLSGPEPEAQD